MSRSGVTCDVWCVVQICCRKFSSAVKCWIQTRVPKYEDNDDVERRRNSFGADTGTFVAWRSSFFPSLWGFSDFFLLQNWGGVFQWEAPLNFVKPPSILEKKPSILENHPVGDWCFELWAFLGRVQLVPFSLLSWLRSVHFVPYRYKMKGKYFWNVLMRIKWERNQSEIFGRE